MPIIQTGLAISAPDGDLRIAAPGADPVTVRKPFVDASPEELRDFGALLGYVTLFQHQPRPESHLHTVRAAAVAFLAQHRQDTDQPSED